MNSKVSFEDSMKRLEDIVKILENGKCSLDESIKLFEEGIALSQSCRNQLDNAELKIKQLLANGEEVNAKFDPIQYSICEE